MLEGWLIELPAWGPRCIGIAESVAIPAIMAALAKVEAPVRFLVHTDGPEQMGKALEGFAVEFRRPDAKGGFQALIAAHNDAIGAARMGEKVALLNADILCSVESFEVADDLLETYGAIATVGMRTVLGPGIEPPIGVDARTLNAWCWENAHPITLESIWGVGRTRLPTVLIWDDGAGNVVMRCFHLCPMFVRKRERYYRYLGTIDDGLLRHFADHEIFFVTNHEMAFAEISPPDKEFGLGAVLSVQSVAPLMRPFHGHHVRNFEQRISVIGDPSKIDEADVAVAIIASLDRRHGMTPSVGRRQFLTTMRDRHNGRMRG